MVDRMNLTVEAQNAFSHILKFKSDLEEGMLSPITKAVISDTSLCLELRGDYIDVYYRGGKLAGGQSQAIHWYVLSVFSTKTISGTERA